MYCVKCGNELQEDEKICSKCGTEIKKTETENTIDILSGPLLNFGCLISLFVLILTPLLLLAMPEAFFNGFVKGVKSLFQIVIFVAISVAIYMVLINRMKKQLGRISVPGLLLAPIKGLVTIYWLSLKLAFYCFFWMPYIGVFMVAITGKLGAAIDEFRYMFIDYSKDPKGRILIF